MEIIKNSKTILYAVLIIVLGAVASFLVFYFYKFSYFKMLDVLNLIFKNAILLRSYLSLTLIINIVIFSILLNFKKDALAILIFAFTCIIGIWAFILKYIV
ncbi:MAG: hypothetical protein QM539_05645 [Alphaproteobacteria bacterium]|nr:hypothetical protein [Alphaproteobacteria bacterium]